MTRSGIDLTDLDPTVRPQDDLFGHMNGRWVTEHEIPADRAMDGQFRILHDQAERDVRDIILESAALPTVDGSDATVESKIGALYASFMDIATIAGLGAAPLRSDLALVDDATDRAVLTEALGALQRTGAASAVSFWVDNDAKDPDRYVVVLHQSGLGLPDESYYREDRYADIRTAYVAHVERMLGLAGYTDGADQAARVFALETRLAAAHWDVVTDRDADLTYNPTTLSALAATAEGFDWHAWARALGAPANALDSLVVREPSFAVEFARAWTEMAVDDWKAWLRFHVVSSRAPYLSDEFVDANFDFYGRTLTGAEELRERWKRGVSVVQGALGEAVGKVYVARHFPPGHKAKMEVLVENLIEAYRESITALDWMGDDTKVRALAKLDAFTPKIGYPARWRDYGPLVVAPDDLLGNIRRANVFDQNRELAKIGRPVDRDEWFMTPQTVNAYYNPGLNEIVFPAAILQPPFFDPEADDAANYGGIGAVIGHEIGHGFDDQGSKYDGTGRLEDWWTADDRAEFEARTRALIAQYDGFRPRQLTGDEHATTHVNGALTIGENIGDLGGVSIALTAYRISLSHAAGHPVGLADAPVVDGLTGLQRVFLGWARTWRSKGRDAEILRRLATDPHSPDEFRCNGVVRNVDAFYDAYDVRPGDALYLSPADRVRIW